MSTITVPVPNAFEFTCGLPENGCVVSIICCCDVTTKLTDVLSMFNVLGLCTDWFDPVTAIALYNVVVLLK